MSFGGVNKSLVLGENGIITEMLCTWGPEWERLVGDVLGKERRESREGEVSEVRVLDSQGERCEVLSRGRDH